MLIYTGVMRGPAAIGACTYSQGEETFDDTRTEPDEVIDGEGTKYPLSFAASDA